jgi:hypothetical protein
MALAVEPTAKVTRAVAAIAAAEQQRRERRAGLSEWCCTACGRLLMEYAAPIGRIVHRCRRCGAWNELTTTTT